MDKNNLIITVSGQYGSGKSILTFLLNKLLCDNGFEVEVDSSVYSSPKEPYMDKKEKFDEMVNILKSKKILLKEEQLPSNDNLLFSGNHLVSTQRGMVKASELKTGDKVVGVKGESTIENIIKCETQPDAPIVGEINKV